MRDIITFIEVLEYNQENNTYNLKIKNSRNEEYEAHNVSAQSFQDTCSRYNPIIKKTDALEEITNNISATSGASCVIC